MTISVKDIMTEPLTTDADNDLKTCGKIMAEARKDAIIIIKKDIPIGIVTDSDLIKKIIAKNIKPDTVKAKDIMSSPIATIIPNDTILDATRKMKRNNIKRLPVLEDGKLVGIISLSDIARTSPEMLDLLEYKIKMRESPTEIKEEFTSGTCDSCENHFSSLEKINGQWLCEECREETEE